MISSSYLRYNKGSRYQIRISFIVVGSDSYNFSAKARIVISDSVRRPTVVLLLLLLSLDVDSIAGRDKVYLSAEASISNIGVGKELYYISVAWSLSIASIYIQVLQIDDITYFGGQLQISSYYLKLTSRYIEGIIFSLLDILVGLLLSLLSPILLYVFPLLEDIGIGWPN